MRHATPCLLQALPPATFVPSLPFPPFPPFPYFSPSYFFPLHVHDRNLYSFEMGDVPLVPSSPSIQRAPRVISTSGWSASPQLWSNILGLVESADSSADSDESCSEPPRKKQRLTPEISIPHGDKGLIPVATFDFQVVGDFLAHSMRLSDEVYRKQTMRTHLGSGRL